MARMTTAQRAAFLREPKVGVLSLSRPQAGPIAVPVWFEYRNGRIWIETGPDSHHGRIMRRLKRATLTVQDERPPYRYVSMEGPVAFTGPAPEPFVRRVAVRYLGKARGDRYMRTVYPTYAGSAGLAVLTPETIWSVNRVL